MANKKIRIRAKVNGDVTEVKSLMSHPMDTGLAKDKKTGEKIPADARILNSLNLKVDESILTGESHGQTETAIHTAPV